MFDRIYVEEALEDHPQTQKILNRFSHLPTKTIDSYESIFGKVKKPYLHKRTNLSLFLAKKKGQLVKEAPSAYGLAGDPHYYFIHAYNCLYECSYCYLQSYFHSPDIVLFLNHNEILNEMQKVVDQTPDSKRPWFHAGEFSDSLALSHLTEEWPLYFDFFAQNPQAFLELRTKSCQIRELLSLTPMANVITSFSLSPEAAVKEYDLKTPSLMARLESMKKLEERGFPLGIHLDPIIYSDDFEKLYADFIDKLVDHINLLTIEYISLGVIRFPGHMYSQVKKNYPRARFHANELISTPEGHVKYPRPLRTWMLSKVKEMLLARGVNQNQIYFCMEN